MKKYKVLKSGIIQDTAKKTFIPKDEKNVDYAEFIKWCDAGNVPDKEK